MSVIERLRAMSVAGVAQDRARRDLVERLRRFARESYTHAVADEAADEILRTEACFQGVLKDNATLAAENEQLEAIVERDKTNAVHRLHNLVDALNEDMDESPFSREAWDQLDAMVVEKNREIARLRAALGRWEVRCTGRHGSQVRCGADEATGE